MDKGIGLRSSIEYEIAKVKRLIEDPIQIFNRIKFFICWFYGLSVSCTKLQLISLNLKQIQILHECSVVYKNKGALAS